MVVRRFLVHRLSLGILGLAVFGVCLFAERAGAVPINYGDFEGVTVRYVDVTENSITDPTPLFGMPVIAGDVLDFSPTAFGSLSTGAGGVDVTDGALTMMIQALVDNSIDQVIFEEDGEFSLTGLGGLGTLAAVTANFFVDILEVDGAPINAIDLQGTMLFTPSNGNWNLADDGPGPLVEGTWHGDVVLDVRQKLIDAGVPFVRGATKVTVTLDNRLSTLSEAGTSAFIAKKDFSGVTIKVPEPASFTISGLGLFVLVWHAARRVCRSRASSWPITD